MLEVVKPGNAKLGKSIGKVALLPVETCPGAGACAKVCYAVKIANMRPNVRAYYEKCTNLLNEDIDAYFQVIESDIRRNGYGIVRFHEAGDFYSIEQIEGWIRVMKRLKHVRFFGYTRSWTIPALFPALERMSTLSNVELFLSVEDGESAPEGHRTASIAPNAFTMHRDGTRTIHEPAGKQSTYCPEQLNIKQSCAECQFCILPPTNKTVNVVFQKH